MGKLQEKREEGGRPEDIKVGARPLRSSQGAREGGAWRVEDRNMGYIDLSEGCSGRGCWAPGRRAPRFVLAMLEKGALAPPVPAPTRPIHLQIQCKWLWMKASARLTDCYHFV